MKKEKIWLVEDDDSIIDLYLEAFQLAGLNLEVIKWGREARERIQLIEKGEVQKPTLFLIDLLLPDVPGVEIIKEIKNTPSTQNIPIFVLTNYTEENLENELKCIVDKFIVKANTTPTKLIKLIKTQLNKEKK